jgi:hypothetical protein
VISIEREAELPRACDGKFGNVDGQLEQHNQINDF